MSPATTGADMPYLSAILLASASARSRFSRHPMIGMAPRSAKRSARAEPRPPGPPARMMDFPFTDCACISFNVNACDKPRVDGLADQRFEFLAQLLPPALRKWLDGLRNF